MIAVVDYDTDADDRLVRLLQATADAAVVMHLPTENGDEVVEALEKDGWSVTATARVAGRRIQYVEVVE